MKYLILIIALVGVWFGWAALEFPDPVVMTILSWSIHLRTIAMTLVAALVLANVD